MAMTPEGKVKKTVGAQLKGINAFFFFPTTGGYGASGIPDVVGCLDQFMFSLELKAGRAQPTALQAMQMRKIQEAGGIAIVVNEINAPTIGVWLQIEIEKRKANVR